MRLQRRHGEAFAEVEHVEAIARRVDIIRPQIGPKGVLGRPKHAQREHDLAARVEQEGSTGRAHRQRPHVEGQQTIEKVGGVGAVQREQLMAGVKDVHALTYTAFCAEAWHSPPRMGQPGSLRRAPARFR